MDWTRVLLIVRRRLAMVLLALLTLPACAQLAALQQQIASDDPARRVDAVMALAELRDPAAADLLLQALQDPDIGVRYTAVRALTLAPDPRAAATLAAFLRGNDARLRDHAANALVATGPAVMETLAPLLKEPNLTMVTAAGDVLLRLDDPTMPAYVLRVLQTPPKPATTFLPDGLLTMMARRDPDGFLRLLRTPDSPYWREATYAISSARGNGLDASAYHPALLAALHHANVGVRARAAGVLGQTQAQEAILELLRLVRTDPDVNVRVSAIEALGTLKATPAVDTLLPLLGGDTPELRVAARNALCEIGDPRAVPGLVAALTDRHASNQYTILTALGKMRAPEAVPALLAELRRNPGDGARSPGEWIITALGQIGAPAVPGLLEALSSKSSYTRLGAIQALGSTGDPRALAPLRALLQDPDPQVRTAAAMAMGQADVLLPLLADATMETRRLAAASLAANDDPRVRDALLRLLQDPVEEVRYAATHALCAHPDPRLLLPMLQEGVYYLASREDPEAHFGMLLFSERQRFISSLARIGTPAIPILRTAIHHREARVRSLAIELLGAIDDPETIPPLLEALGSTDEDDRNQAVYALLREDSFRQDSHAAATTRCRQQAAPALLPLLREAPQTTRLYAALVLIRLGDRRAVPAFLELLNDPHSEIRLIGIAGLRAFQDRCAVAPLLEALRDADPAVRFQASYALGAFNDLRAVPPLLAMLQAREPSAVVTMPELPRGVAEIINAQTMMGFVMPNEPLTLRMAAAQVLGRLGDVRAVPALAAALQEYTGGKTPTDGPPLVKREDGNLAENNWALRFIVTQALVEIGDPAVPALRPLLQHRDVYLRKHAITALGKIGDPSIIADLKRLEHDPEVRYEVKDALEQLTTRR